MKRLFSLLCSFGLTLLAFGAIDVARLEPSFWWAGMQNTELQIMVYGKDIARTVVSVAPDAPVQIKRVVKGDSPNYLFVYLDLANAEASQFDLLFSAGKEKRSVSYELRARTVNPALRKGFDTSDVLYLIMPDRFANGDPSNDVGKMRFPSPVDRADPSGRHGGDLKGIADRLDYIADLGMTAIWLNPVLENDMPGACYHGYAATDYYKIDARFGTNEDYKGLIEKAHSKGLKVVMDMIFNHCGSEHPWIKDFPTTDWVNMGGKYVMTNHAKETLHDPYSSEYDTKRMTDGWFVESMPDLNQRNPHLATYLIQNSIWWIEYSGIDAIRQDTHPYADYEMMARWCKAVMTEYPNFNIVGEAWMNYSAGCAFWQEGAQINGRGNTNLKSVMDFKLNGIARDAFHHETDWDNGLTKIFEHLGYDFLYPDVNNLLCFLDNHDTDRFLPSLPSDLGAFKQATTFLLTSRGIPQIYYGTEILMNGTKKRSDGDIRQDFPGGWQGDQKDAFTSAGRTPLQNEAFQFMRQILNWRKGNEVIAKGTLKHFNPRNGAYLYCRSFNGRKAIILMNGTSKSNTVDLAQYREVLPRNTVAKEVITGRQISFIDQITLAPREVIIVEI